MSKIRTEYGEFKVEFGGQEFTFKPSLENISSIGTPEEIINVFCDVNHINYMEWRNNLSALSNEVDKQVSKHYKTKALQAAILVLRSCCDKDPISMTGGFRMGRKAFYQVGFEDPKNLIILAKHLLNHGVIGVRKETKRKPKGRKGKFESKFFASEYVDIARVHLGLSRDEAWTLTMTEFVSLFDAKFPEKEDESKFEVDKSEYDKFKAKTAEIKRKIKEQRVTNG